MTIIFHKADLNKLLDEPHIENVNLFMQFFIPDDMQRYKELKQTMYFNVTNPNIDKIYLLNERYYMKEELGIEKTKKHEYMKIRQANVGKRLSFEMVFNYVREQNIKGYIVFANTDIFFDSLISNVCKTGLHQKKGIYCLVRHEYKDRNLRKCKLFGGGRADSQDVWIIHSNYIPEKTRLFNFKFGVPGCDNKLVYLFLVLGYKVYNNPLLIKAYHNHKSQQRNYTGMVNYPFCYLVPTMPGKSHISKLCKFTHKLRDLKNIEDEVDYFSKMVFTDNEKFIKYLNKKIKKNEHFVIPRVAGVENNVAHIVYMLNNKLENKLFDLALGKVNILTEQDKDKLDHDVHYSGIKNYLGAMKNNAGVKIGGTYSLTKYTIDYLDAFKNCELYFGWEKWGNVYKYIIDSHDFINIKYKKKQMLSSLALDIFHYIHNPWTHALKGKRILIISPFIESIKEKENIRKEIYGVDLFPECQFIYMKPPQTQGVIESKDYYIELEPFLDKIRKRKEEFDIALCSCGGYGNIVVNYIYNLQRSAIYVGGVLQMYFGIYGSRWLRERKDILKLYLNKHWSRPKESERPEGFKSVEGSAYW